MSSFTELANEAIAEAEDEAVVEAPPAVDAAETVEAAPDPEARIHELLQSHGFGGPADFDQAVEVTPGAAELFAKPIETEADLERSAALLRSLQSQSETSEAVRRLAVEQAVEAYEAGEYEPAVLADHLEATFGEAVSGEFVQRWLADEIEWEEPDEGPASAQEWLAQKVQRAEEAARIRQAVAHAEVQAAATANVEATRQEIAQTLRELQGLPNFEGLTSFVEQIAHRMPPESLPTNPQDAREFVERSYRGAQEAARVEETARIQARMEQRAQLRDGRGDPPSKAEMEARLERRVAELMGAQFRADAVNAPPTVAEEHRAITEPFGRRNQSNGEHYEQLAELRKGGETLRQANQRARKLSAASVLARKTRAEEVRDFNEQLEAAVVGDDFRNWPGH